VLCWSNTSTPDVSLRRLSSGTACITLLQTFDNTTIYTPLTTLQHAGTPRTCNFCPSFSALRSTSPCHDTLGRIPPFAEAEEYGERKLHT
jgi:hypothetical protein